MIGNDIVDLAVAKRESNWQRRGFLDKVFTKDEQHLIQTASDPDTLVWLLWSLKESAYKLAVRHTQNREFAPKKIDCFLYKSSQETQTGHVVYGAEVYQTRSIITAQYVATIAFRAGVTPVYTHIIAPFDDSTYSTQHHSIREHIKRYCAARLGVYEPTISVKKNKDGTPELTVGDSSPIPITLSYHGRYGAYGIPF